MCGISGCVLKSNRLPLLETLKQMNSVISHRGPDGEGFYYDDKTGLAHRRLAIIDLSDDGHQPMSLLDGQVTITYNGEVYNYLELRAELADLGYVFRSQSDTEVILAAYLQWGEDCVSRFNGMWAFAIYDKRSNTLFCSRDRFGVKPFYFVETEHGLFFGSEIRQLLPLAGRISANKDLLIDFLVTSICDHSNDTFFKGVSKLPAGHNFIYRISNYSGKIVKYYELKRDLSLQDLQPEEAIAIYASRFSDAVRIRMRSDVPVATCLSGGLDSSSVASIAAPIYESSSGKAFSAITAVSEQECNNEAAYAEMVVRNSRLNWLQVKPGFNDFLEALPAVVHAQEEPFGSTSLIMQYFVMKEARKNAIPVLLDGQGGDETLLGYPKYYGSYLATTFRDRGFSCFLDALRASGQNNSKMNLSNALFFLLGGMVAPARYLVYLARNRYLSSRPAYPPHLSDFARCSWDDFELQKLEITRTNLPVLLRYEDKNSMAHSIETRLPFLDYRVVETALSLPGSCKIREGWSKWVLRKSMNGKMPDDITWRKNKFGFEAPENIWMKRHLPEMKNNVMRSPLISEFSKRSVLDRQFEGLNIRTQWRLYSLALWEKEFGVVA